jgi:hypothetical protein
MLAMPKPGGQGQENALPYGRASAPLLMSANSAPPLIFLTLIPFNCIKSQICIV